MFFIDTRMDKDQSKRRNLLLVDPTFHDPDYYEFESKQRK